MSTFVCFRPRHLLIALALASEEPEQKHAFVVATGIADGQRALAQRLRRLGLWEVWDLDEMGLKQTVFKGGRASKLVRLFRFRRLIDSEVHLPLSLFRDRKTFLFHDQTFLGQFVLRHATCVVLVEDGTTNYLRRRPTPMSLLRRLVGIHPVGNDPRIRNILLADPNAYRGKRSRIVKKLPLVELTDKLVCDHREVLDEVFGLDSTSPVFSLTGLVSVVITQPLALVGVMTLKEQQRVFEHILLRCPGTPVLKRHPQDTVQYRSPSGYEIDGDIPFEILFYLLDNRRTRYITLYSTSTGVPAGTNYCQLVSVRQNKSQLRNSILAQLERTHFC